MSLREILQEARGKFAASQIDGVDAELLLASTLGINRMELHSREFTLTNEQSEEFARLCSERLSGTPTQYLIGSAPFRHLQFDVGPGVLIPRPETEMLVDAALSVIGEGTQPVSVVDLGAGTGAIAISIAYEAAELRRSVTVVAVEKEEAALSWLRRNIALHSVDVRVVASDVMDALHDVRADIVVANPPYIPSVTTLPALVADYEPASALLGGGELGLDIPYQFIRAASRILKPGGILILEHDESQRERLEAFLSQDYRDIKSFTDLNGRDRMITARRSG